MKFSEKYIFVYFCHSLSCIIFVKTSHKTWIGVIVSGDKINAENDYLFVGALSSYKSAPIKKTKKSYKSAKYLKDMSLSRFIYELVSVNFTWPNLATGSKWGQRSTC